MGALSSGLGRLAGPAQAGDRSRSLSPADPTAADTLPLVGVILNPKSHRNAHLDRSDFTAPGVITVLPRTKSEIAEALHEFARRKIGVLVIGGGDGTVRDVLTRAAPVFGDSWPNIVILPQGKTNALAIDLGLPSRWTLAEALDAARRGRIVERRPLIVDSHHDDEKARYGFIFGAGVFNAAIEAGQVAHRFGAFQSFAVGVTVVFGVIQALFGWGKGPWRRQYRMNLSDAKSGKELPFGNHGTPGGRFLTGFTTLRRFPLGIHPFPQGGQNDGPIAYFLFDAPLRRGIAMFPAVMLGLGKVRLAPLGMHRGTLEAVDIELEDGFILDGESFPAGKFRVCAGPPMRFIAP